MIDLIETYVHWYAGRSQARIADSLGVDRETVRKYLGPVTASGLMPGGPPVMSEADWRARAQEWFPALVDTGLRQVTWPAIEVHRDPGRPSRAASPSPSPSSSPPPRS